MIHSISIQSADLNSDFTFVGFVSIFIEGEDHHELIEFDAVIDAQGIEDCEDGELDYPMIAQDNTVYLLTSISLNRGMLGNYRAPMNAMQLKAVTQAIFERCVRVYQVMN